MPTTDTARATTNLIGDDAKRVTADIGDLPLCNADVTDHPAVSGFIKSVEEAVGAVFVTPEYNYSIPGVLKTQSTGLLVLLFNRSSGTSIALSCRFRAVRWVACVRKTT